MFRAKKMPKLDKLLVRSMARRKQSWQEQLAIMQMWAAKQKMAIAMRAEDGG